MSVAGPLSPGARCSVHPARRARDRCPVCGRNRCEPDAVRNGAGGCDACRGDVVGGAAAGRRELWVRAMLAAAALVFAGGWVGAEYVDTRYFATIVPGLVGLGCAWAAAAAAPELGRSRQLGVGAVAGVLAAALSDRLVPGGQNLFLPPGHRLPPYAAAVVGALVWPVLFGPGAQHRGADQPVGRSRR